MLNLFTTIGDPHITLNTLDKGTQLFNLVESKGLPAIWLGDFLDTKEVIRGKCLNLIYNYFLNSKLQHIIIVGNHDYFNLDCEDHSLRVLAALPNVTIIDSVKKHPTLPFVFFPYIHDKQLLKLELQKYSNQNLIAFGHFEVSGFDFGNGQLCEDGQITHEDFKGYRRVISGHFHKLQQTGNFTYLGTPFSHSFGEANQDKVLGQYELSTDTLTLYPTDFPRHLSIKIDLGKANAAQKLAKFLDGNEGNLNRVQLHGTPEQVSQFDRSKFGEYTIKWEDKSEAPDSLNVTIDDSLSNKAQFREWASNVKKLDQETLELGLQILEAAGAK